MIEAGCQVNPDHAYVIAMHQPGDTLPTLVRSKGRAGKQRLEWSYAEMRLASCRLASQLLKDGVEPGSTLATFISNRAEWTILYWTAALLRLTFVPLDHRALTAARKHELKTYMETLRPSVVVVNDADETEVLDSVCKETALDVRVKTTLRNAKKSWRLLDTIAADMRASDMIDGHAQTGDDDPERTAIILFTSGTSTGKPKGVPMSVQNICAGQATYVLSRHIDHTQRFILHTANFRAAAASYTMACASTAGTLIMPGDGFSTVGVLDAIEKEYATNIWVVPAQVFAIIEDPEFRTRDLSALRVLCISGDMVTKSVLEKSKQAFGSANVISGHGMTEGIGNLGWLDAEQDIPAFGEIVAVGTVLPGTRLKLVEDGHLCKMGDIGELHMGGPKMITGYLDKEQQELFYTDDAGHWVITGDRARLDQNGNVFILGRSKDIIKRKGIPIPPAAIESCLNRHSGMTQCFGIPDPILGENPIAVVRSTDGSDERTLKKVVVDTMGPDFALGHVLTLEKLGFSDWPVNETGKVIKTKLKDAAIGFLAKRNGS